jgi:hypothetical protein
MCVDFVMCGCVYVRGFCNVWMCICVWMFSDNCVGVLVTRVLILVCFVPFSLCFCIV